VGQVYIPECRHNVGAYVTWCDGNWNNYFCWQSIFVALLKNRLLQGQFHLLIISWLAHVYYVTWNLH